MTKPELREALRRCGKRVVRGEKLLEWVAQEVNLDGHMELLAEIRAYLEER